MIYKTYIKRPLDFCLALIGSLVAAPFALIIAILVKLDSAGPILFRQQRLGRQGREFTFYKFRTMEVNAECRGNGVYCVKDDPRVTRVGKILRNASLDEIPQLINILKGDMSFVGMRPPLTYHPCKIDEYTPKQKRVFEQRPGITGWAQINGRNAVQWDKRIKLNLWYNAHISFLVDAKIVFRTIPDVLRGKDVIIQANTVAGFNGRAKASD